MATVTTNLGVVTAYGDALAGGYTGTKAEFQTAMNNYAQGIANASEALAKSNANLTNTADTYSASATYAVGDYVLYGNQLYKCTTAITTAEAWTSGHWTAVNIGDGLAGINDRLIEAQNTQPSDEINRLWIDTDSTNEVQVPTYSEFTDLNTATDDVSKTLLGRVYYKSVMSPNGGWTNYPINATLKAGVAYRLSFTSESTMTSGWFLLLNSDGTALKSLDISNKKVINETYTPDTDISLAYFRVSTNFSTAQASVVLEIFDTSIAPISNDVHDNKAAIKVNAIGSMVYNTFVQGARNTSYPESVVHSRNRVTLSECFTSSAGDTIKITGPTSTDIVYFLVGKCETPYDSGSLSSNFTYNVEQDGIYFVNARKTDASSAILPSEVDITVTLEKSLNIGNRAYDKAENVKNVVINMRNNYLEKTYNLFDPASYVITKNAHITFDSDNNTIITATVNAENCYCACVIDVRNITQVSISWASESGTGSSMVRIGYSTDGKTLAGWIRNVNSGVVHNVSSYNYIVVGFNAVYVNNPGIGNYISYNSVQIVEGRPQKYVKPYNCPDENARTQIKRYLIHSDNAVVGMQLSDIYSSINGAYLRKAIEVDAYDCTPNNIYGTHESNIYVHNGYIYLVIGANKTDSSEDHSKYNLELIKASIDGTLVSSQSIIAPGDTLDGETVERCQAAFILPVDNTIHIYCNIDLPGTNRNSYTMFHTEYNITNNTIGEFTEVYYTNNDRTNLATTPYEMYISTNWFSYGNHSYCTAVYFDTNNCGIGYTEDFINFNFIVFLPDIEQVIIGGEMSAGYISGLNKFVIAYRTPSDCNYLYYRTYDITNSEWSDFNFIPDATARPMFFNYQGNLYLANNSPYSRKDVTIWKVLTYSSDVVWSSKCLLEPMSVARLNHQCTYFSFYEYNNDLYMACIYKWLTKIIVAKIKPETLTKEDVNEKILNLMS